MKTCPRCGVSKEATEFHNNCKTKDGLACWCKPCKARDHQRNKEHNNARTRAAYVRRVATPEGHTKHKANSDRWREQNRDKLNAAVADWKRRNLAKHAAYQRNRKARAMQAGGTHTADDVQALLNTQGYTCFYCPADLSNGYHVDHKTPLARGGSNGPDNLAVACAPCNLSKNKLTAEEYIALKSGGLRHR